MSILTVTINFCLYEFNCNPKYFDGAMSVKFPRIDKPSAPAVDIASTLFGIANHPSRVEPI